MSVKALPIVIISLTVLIALIVSGDGRKTNKIDRLVEDEEERLRKQIETNSLLESSEESDETDESLKDTISLRDGKTLSASNKQYIPLVYWHGMGMFDHKALHGWNLKKMMTMVTATS
jgi:hypothetical protein